MILKNKLNNICLSDNGILLSFKYQKQIEISFRELNKIHIKVIQIRPVHEFLFMFGCVGFATLCLLYLPFDIALFIPFALVIIAAIKINNYKNYELCITLKNGDVLRKTVPLKLKYKTLEIVDSARKEIYLAKIKTENTVSKN
ncbi:hypothetical protein D3C85_360320 [compost metagenome]